MRVTGEVRASFNASGRRPTVERKGWKIQVREAIIEVSVP